MFNFKQFYIFQLIIFESENFHWTLSLIKCFRFLRTIIFFNQFLYKRNVMIKFQFATLNKIKQRKNHGLCLGSGKNKNKFVKNFLLKDLNFSISILQVIVFCSLSMFANAKLQQLKGESKIMYLLFFNFPSKIYIC